jgi:hypothetical protein
MFGKRPDATLVRDASAVRRFMPFISPRRNDSLVLFTQVFDVTAALEFASERNAARPDDAPMTLFHLILRALARALDERPRLNRFVAGGRLWQRDGIWLTFSAKKRFDDDAELTTVKRRVDPSAPLDAWVDHLLGGIREGKSDKKSTSDKEVELLLRLPSPLTRLVMGAVHLLDAFGLLPLGMIRPDPMYSSAFIANLGSVGLDAGYHHLWEHGTCPIFCVIGRIQEGPDGRKRAELKWSYDERTEDGLYCATALERIRELVENPTKLA